MKKLLSYWPLLVTILGTVMVFQFWKWLDGEPHYGQVTNVTATFKNGELDQVMAHIIIEDTIEADVPVGGVGKTQTLLLAVSNNNMLDQYTAKVMFSFGKWRDVEEFTYNNK